MIIYLDFDGTVVEHAYPKLGRINFGCMEVIRKLQNAGHTIILNTYRSDLNNGVDEALQLLNEQAWMCQTNQPKDYEESELYEDFQLDTIVSTTKKIQPQQWDIETAIHEDIMFIDDIAPNIPLKPSVMVKGNMVDWDAIDAQFQQYGIY